MQIVDGREESLFLHLTSLRLEMASVLPQGFPDLCIYLAPKACVMTKEAESQALQSQCQHVYGQH